jgi:hypothetical protein
MLVEKKRQQLGGLRVPSDGTVKAEVQKWVRERDVTSCRQGAENIVVHCDKCLTSLVTVWKNKGLVSKHNDDRYLPLVYLH